MFELHDEKVLMYSDDMSVRLTTHRIIQQSQTTKNEIMLEDYENYEIRSAHIGNYKLLTIIFVFTTVLLLFKRGVEYLEYPDDMFFNSLVSYLLVLSASLLAISIHFYWISRRYFVRINGKFGYIEFRIINPKKKSVPAFLDRLFAQSNIVKNQSTSNE